MAMKQKATFSTSSKSGKAPQREPLRFTKEGDFLTTTTGERHFVTVAHDVSPSFFNSKVIFSLNAEHNPSADSVRKAARAAEDSCKNPEDIALSKRGLVLSATIATLNGNDDVATSINLPWSAVCMLRDLFQHAFVEHNFEDLASKTLEDYALQQREVSDSVAAYGGLTQQDQADEEEFVPDTPRVVVKTAFPQKRKRIDPPNKTTVPE